MKKRIIYALIFFSWMGESCQDFLDVSPRETEKRETLFETQSGFRTALTGVYLMLADDDLYGYTTSMYFPELLARHWSVPINDRISDLYVVSNYDFSDYKGNALITNTWTAYYKAIAQLNDILDALKNSDVVFTDNTEKFIEGEARGLRALIYLDLLRFWGPVPALADPETLSVPYVVELTHDAQKLVAVPWKTVTEGIRNDLDQAEKLLADIDPIRKYNPDDLNFSRSSSGVDEITDRWFYYRQNRMNYYAVLAAKARFYNWIATNSASAAEAKPLAVQYAKQLIEAVNAETQNPQFSLGDFLNILDNGLILYRECIFALHNPKLQNIIKPAFIDDTPLLTQSTDNLNIAYEASLNAQDVRYGSISDGRYWIPTTDASKPAYNHFAKYNEYGRWHTWNQVPLLRLSEMYLILLENLPVTEANAYFKTFRIARAMSNSLDNSLTEGNIRERIEKEYRKEFYGEGQMFFFYKRYQYSSFTYPETFPLPQGLADYRLPLPKNQQIFEN
ncbi:MAG: RagB/SusD family nutrient uptake outer membrane protein [Dysgonamonadaceae bacterium]|jgi:hypothetical protein|nr:RagB/SusD family nutrient uptake outer membrane protein [Dysgonamonadaceae bacterium]